jgi:uncharacterized protein (TIGR03435 family)
MRIGFVSKVVAIMPAAILFAGVCVADGQTAAAAPAPAAQATASTGPVFDVASVRPAAAIDQATIFAGLRAGKRPEEMRIAVDRATFKYYSLKQLVAYAYVLPPIEVTGPDWMTTDRFDVVAKLPDGASKDNVPEMMKALLADRFKLAAHLETKDRPVLGLMLGKSGPKMKPVPAPAALDDTPELKPGQTRVDSSEGPVILTRNADGSTTYDMGTRGSMTLLVNGQTGTMDLDGRAMTMKGLAARLTSLGSGSGRPVVDLTGLTGNYDVKVVFALSDLVSGLRDSGINIPTGPPGADEPSGNGTVADALDMLGLKLQGTKAPVEQLVIDHVEKAATDN